MGKLYEELKRRKVFRVAAVYAVVAWLLIQVVTAILPTFEAPNWVSQSIILILILGFPIAVILAWAYEATPEGVHRDSGQISLAPAPANQWLIYATFILVLVVAGFQISDRFLFSSVTQTEAPPTSVLAPKQSRRFSISIGNTAPLAGPLVNADIALSADGSKLVYRVYRQDTETESLYLKYLNQLEEHVLLSGSRRTVTPFFSTDGEWVGYGTDNPNVLYKAALQGGAPQLLAEFAQSGHGGFWGPDNTVYFSSVDRQLMRVSANGGVPESLNIESDNFNLTQSWPYLLPGDDALLYTVAPFGSIRSGRIDLLVQSTGEVRTIVQNGYNARYVPTGHIVFVRDAALWAAPFDPDKLQTTGPERLVVEGIQTNTSRGLTPYAFSDDGLLVYLPGGDTMVANVAATTLVWVDREGNEEVLPMVRNFSRWAVSPEGRRLAVSITEDNGNADIWIYDLVRNTLSRLTFDESDDNNPLWTPDGERVVFSSSREGGVLWSRAANGTGVAEPLLDDNSVGTLFPYAVTPDGAQLLYYNAGYIHTLTPGAEVPSQLLLQTEFNTRRPDLSPDGRWLAYSSDETGREEIYVRPFPNIDDGKWQISGEGGQSPKWSPDGLELFYASLENRGDTGIWVAQRETADTPQFDMPVPAFEGSDAIPSYASTFDISADGSRLLLRKDAENTIRQTESTLLIAVENWFEELKRLAPADPE